MTLFRLLREIAVRATKDGRPYEFGTQDCPARNNAATALNVVFIRVFVIVNY